MPTALSISRKLQLLGQYVLYALPLLLAVSRAGGDVAVCIIGVCFLLRSLLEKDWRWTQKPELRLLAALWLFMLATSPLSAEPQVAATSALIWGRLLLFYAALTCWLLTPATLKTTARIGMCILLLLSVDTAWQYVTGVSLSGKEVHMFHRLTGPMPNPNIGNLLLKCGLPFTGILLFMAIKAHHRRQLYLTAAAGFILSAIIFISGERSSALLMLLGIVVAGGLSFIFQPGARKGLFAAAIALAVMFAALAMTQSVVQERSQFMVKQLSDFRHSPYGQLYTMAYELWKQHPLIGIGANVYRQACEPNMQAFGVTECNIHPHNLYLEWLVDTGLIGLGLFLLAMGTIVWRQCRSAVFTGPAGILAAFSLAIIAVVIFPLIVTQSVFANWAGILFWYSLSLGVALPRAADA